MDIKIEMMAKKVATKVMKISMKVMNISKKVKKVAMYMYNHLDEGEVSFDEGGKFVF